MSDGFQRFESANTRVWIADSYVEELAPLDLCTAGALERWCAAGEPVPGGRARGWRLPLASGRIVHLRELAHGGALRHFTGRRFLAVDRATAALEAAARLHGRGVAVPRPVLMRGQRRGAFWELAIANEFIEPSAPAGAYLEASETGARARAARRAGAAVRAFHDAGGRHRDLHVDNLLVGTDDPGAPDLWIVDPDGIRAEDRPAGTEARRGELRRLLRSLRKRRLEASAVRSCTVAFLRGYVGRDLAFGRTLVVP